MVDDGRGCGCTILCGGANETVGGILGEASEGRKVG